MLARLARSTAAAPLARPMLCRGMAIAAGSKFPSVEVDHASWPPTAFDLADHVKDKKVIIVGLPGAFTPT